MKNFNYGIVGLGIMGGSFAKAIKANVLPFASGKIFAFDKNETVLQKAKSENIIDNFFTKENLSAMLSLCDIVFVCLYPHDVISFLEQNQNHFKKGAIVTDISGVKCEIAKKLKSVTNLNIDFILGHPMAGGEKEGFEFSNANFFKQRNYIIIEQEWNKKENIALFKSIVLRLGFKRIVETSVQTHDYNIAFTSQLCHVIASALVKSKSDKHITKFGGGSFEDLTRIALINAPLWTELFLQNKQNLLEHITNFEKEISLVKKFLQEDDYSKLEKYLSEVRSIRSEMQTSE